MNEAGSTDIEKKNAGRIADKLEAINAKGIILSPAVEQQIKDEAAASKGSSEKTLDALAALGNSLTALEQRRKSPETMYKIQKADFELVEGNLRRINSVGEVAGKLRQMNSLNTKYSLLNNHYDDLRTESGPLPRSRAYYSPAEVAKVHAMPLEKAVVWLQRHQDRLGILNDLIKAGVIPEDQYNRFRQLDPDKALVELRTIQAKHAGAGSR